MESCKMVHYLTLLDNHYRKLENKIYLMRYEEKGLWLLNMFALSKKKKFVWSLNEERRDVSLESSTIDYR